MAGGLRGLGVTPGARRELLRRFPFAGVVLPPIGVDRDFGGGGGGSRWDLGLSTIPIGQPCCDDCARGLGNCGDGLGATVAELGLPPWAGPAALLVGGLGLAFVLTRKKKPPVPTKVFQFG